MSNTQLPKEVHEMALTAVEAQKLADRIASTRAQIVEEDIRRQGAVEALGKFRQATKDPKYAIELGDNVWVSGGSCFFKLSKQQAESMCRSTVQQTTAEIDQMRVSLKKDAATLMKIAPDKEIDQASLKLLLSDKPKHDVTSTGD